MTHWSGRVGETAARVEEQAATELHRGRGTVGSRRTVTLTESPADHSRDVPFGPELPPVGKPRRSVPLLAFALVVLALIAATTTTTTLYVQARDDRDVLVAENVEQDEAHERSQARVRELVVDLSAAEDEAALNLEKYETAQIELVEFKKTAQSVLDSADARADEAAAAAKPAAAPSAAPGSAEARVLQTARSYLEFMPMGPDTMRRQLVDYEGFTPEQAEYAISQLY